MNILARILIGQLIKIFEYALQSFAFYLVGREKERRKQQEIANEILQKQADIDAHPDLSRDELNQRMRDRANH